LALVAGELPGARFVDLFAGTGAVGLEALSRGATSADLVENGASALHALKANVAALRERKRTRIFKRDAIPWVQKLDVGAYDIAYVDPPYGSRKLDRILDRWMEVPFARVVVVEHDAEHPVRATGRSWSLGSRTRLTLLRAPADAVTPQA
jgi:16S rRNA (guanine966-N2)-methyltransferase